MSIQKKIKNANRFIKMDRESGSKIDFGMLKEGFFSKRRSFYPFEQYHNSLFLTDWEIEFKFSSINSSVSQETLKNKLFFQLLLKEAGLENSTPGLIGMLDEGKYQSFSDLKRIEDAFKNNNKIFLKPVSGSGGRECFIAKKIEDLPRDGHYIIEKCAIAHPYSEKIFPNSINTIRVFTLKSRSGEPFIVGAAHRFGMNTKQPVDNFSKGGIACGIDLSTGVLSKGVTTPGLYPENFHDIHPTTHEQLTGVIVPFWSEVKELSIILANYFGNLNYAGWDIYVSPTGPKIIEGNGGIANPHLIQVHGPLLCSEEVREQLYRLGVLSKKRLNEIKKAIKN